MLNTETGAAAHLDALPISSAEGHRMRVPHADARHQPRLAINLKRRLDSCTILQNQVTLMIVCLGDFGELQQ